MHTTVSRLAAQPGLLQGLRAYQSAGVWCGVEALEGDHIILKLGLTADTLDAIGDPLEVQGPVDGSLVPAQAPLAGVTWEGFRRSASDELYHATWGHSRGRHDIQLPFAATKLGLNPTLQACPDQLLHPDEQHWVVRVRALRRDFQQALDLSLISQTPTGSQQEAPASMQAQEV